MMRTRDRRRSEVHSSPARDRRLVAGPCISLSPRKITFVLASIVVVLEAAHVAVYAMYYSFLTNDEFGKVVALFNLNDESNPAAWYSSSTLLVCAMLLGIISIDKIRNHDAYAVHWLGLAIVFLYSGFRRS